MDMILKLRTVWIVWIYILFFMPLLMDFSTNQQLQFLCKDYEDDDRYGQDCPVAGLLQRLASVAYHYYHHFSQLSQLSQCTISDRNAEAIIAINSVRYTLHCSTDTVKYLAIY